MNQNWPAIRIVHSLGGLRLACGLDKKVIVEPNTLDHKVASFLAPDYHSLFNSIHTLNLPIYGVDLIVHDGQLDGTDIPLWHPIMYYPSEPYDYEKAIRLWSNISTGSHRAKNGHRWDLSSRISHQLRIAAWRLREISEAYRIQLDACLKRGEFKDNSHFSDGFTWICFMSIQAFLIDACILRDYLAEYASAYIYNENIEQKNLRITTLSGLLKHVIYKIETKDSLATEIEDISKEGGWLKKLGDYRDLVIHSAPLSHAEKKSYAIKKLFKLQKNYLPYIVCPIPDNPSKIYKFRHSLESYINFDTLFNSFVDIFDEAYTTDGLTYCYHSLADMARFALKLGATSPVKPEIATLSEADIADLEISR